MISEKVGFLNTRVKVGIIVGDKNCILIDSGLDSSTGKKILSRLRREELNVMAIIITHSHADHYGGTAFIKECAGARVYASTLEAAIIENPVLEPIYFAGGAHPPTELKNKFMMGTPCKIDQIVGEGSLEIGSMKVNIINLPGHSPQQIGVIAEGILFCADSVFPTEVLEKHKILFLHNVEDFRNSLTRLLTINCENFLPSHGKLVKREEFVKLVNSNLASTEEVEEKIIEILNTPLEINKLISIVLDRFEMSIDRYSDYALFSSTLKAYLNYLKDKEGIGFKMERNQLLVYKKD
ncbi:MAG: MBL fold metallo-hydrolase [Candidatus Jordarchaeum sp.]|uniref:MBL fold metallo-hydrolase n=1 Tax=Candidatus Jordarchaeum sp. TaxID=2823881 RepID=UPI004049601D